MLNKQDIVVRYAAGAYTTNTVSGNRASSTASSEAAARKLGVALFGPSFLRVYKVPCHEYGGQRWRVYADPNEWAFCWATGLIGFGPAVPNGALALARGPRRALHESVAVRARHAKPRSPTKQAFLVPGIPEAGSEKLAGDALEAFLNWCATVTPKKSSHGVVWWPEARGK
jgi:hypothetical protein